MKTTLTLCLASLLASALAHAGPAEDLAAAADKLGAAPNYSWKVTTEFANTQFPAMPTEGVTEKDGYTVVTTSFNGTSRQTVRKGERIVMQNREGDWMTGEEIRQQFANAGANGGGGGARPAGGAGAGGGRAGIGLFMLGRGAQMDVAHNAAELARKIKEPKLEGDTVEGTLSEADAAALLSFGRGGRGGNAPAPKNASATVKFWLKDGAVAKYMTTVKGTVTTPNGDERDVEVTTTAEISNVGSTKVVVPEAAKQKLDS